MRITSVIKRIGYFTTGSLIISDFVDLAGMTGDGGAEILVAD